MNTFEFYLTIMNSVLNVAALAFIIQLFREKSNIANQMIEKVKFELERTESWAKRNGEAANKKNELEKKN